MAFRNYFFLHDKEKLDVLLSFIVVSLSYYYLKKFLLEIFALKIFKIWILSIF